MRYVMAQALEENLEIIPFSLPSSPADMRRVMEAAMAEMLSLAIFSGQFFLAAFQETPLAKMSARAGARVTEASRAAMPLREELRPAVVAGGDMIHAFSQAQTAGVRLFTGGFFALMGVKV